jgi:hypothetical protein
MSFFISFDQCKFEVYLVRDKYCYSFLFSGAIGLVNLLPHFLPKPILVSVRIQDGFPVSNKLLDLLFKPFYQMVPFDGGINSINIKR